MTERDAIVHALVKVQNFTDIAGELYALHYYGRDMSPTRRAAAIQTARASAEELLTSIIAAEQAMSLPAPSPSIAPSREQVLA